MSVVAPKGFRAAGVAAGVKPAGELDLALVAADAPAAAAALFTVNRAAAPPVRVSRRHLAEGTGICAVVINSGCANAATGSGGEAAAVATAARVGAGLSCEPEQVIVGSTGPIGPRLPLREVLVGVDDAVGSLGDGVASGTAAATAIMTTDTHPKEVVVSAAGFTVGAMAKGAGMVRPDLATMLVVLTTDAAVDDAELDAALRPASDRAFHGLNVDGCSSTNDMVVALASGAGGYQPEPAQLAAAFDDACDSLALMLAADAEGAGRVVTMEVSGAASDHEARQAGRTIADSVLVRASWYGGDPNWGRIVGALGAGAVDFDPRLFGVSFAGVPVAERGEAVAFDAAGLQGVLAEGDFTVRVVLGEGPGSAIVRSTDLTPEYVRFNAEPS